jgi:hypothetical protein
MLVRWSRGSQTTKLPWSHFTYREQRLALELVCVVAANATALHHLGRFLVSFVALVRSVFCRRFPNVGIPSEN